MQNLLEYESFYEAKKEDLFFARHNMPSNYADRARSYGIPIPGNSILTKVYNFLGGFENYLDRFASAYSSTMKQRRAERGGGPNTGIESIFKLFSAVPGVLKRIFGPSVMKYKGAEKDQVSLELMRHTNEVYMKEDLPKIKNQGDLARNLADLYQKAGVKPKQNPALDEIARNRATIYFSKHPNEIPVDRGNFHTLPEIASIY